MISSISMFMSDTFYLWTIKINIVFYRKQGDPGKTLKYGNVRKF